MFVCTRVDVLVVVRFVVGLTNGTVVGWWSMCLLVCSGKVADV